MICLLHIIIIHKDMTTVSFSLMNSFASVQTATKRAKVHAANYQLNLAL